VTIESGVGVGTSVRLFFPRLERSALVSQPVTASAAPRRSPLARRVLVVEDDPDVRELMVELLEGFGYDVFAAESGPGALTLLDGGLAVDLVVSDVLMPDGLSGFQLAREIRRRSPRLPIVLTSGMTDPAYTAADAMLDLPILRKPYRCEALQQAIEAVLDAASRDGSPG
jgi:CheY-like chemotaxis protein